MSLIFIIMNEFYKILTENQKDNIDQDILNFLRRRHETQAQVLGKDDYAITVYVLRFDIKGEIYAFNNYMSKKELTYKIVNMLEETEAISLGEYNPRIFDENRQKVVQTVRYFLDNFFNVKNKKPINEEYKYEINEVEPVLKLVLMQKYDWLKDLKLKNLRILDLGMIFINGLMIVDEEWGAKKWREQYMTTSFPGNFGWETGDYYDIVALGDILGKEESEEIKNEIIDIVKYVTAKEIKNEGNMSFALKFV